MEHPYKQLIVWDPDNEAILGGYRFILGSEVAMDEQGQPVLASSHQFRFSQKFIDDYLPYVIELGRNFVAPEYQSSKNGAKSIFAMDNLWDGLVAIIMRNPDLLYYFGKITLYPSYDHTTRDRIYHFLWKHFGDKDELVRPWDDQAILPDSDPKLMNLIVNKEDPMEDYKLLRAAARMRNVNVPPNFTAYISSTSHMLMFGTAVNRLMDNIEDSAVLIPFDKITFVGHEDHLRLMLSRVEAFDDQLIQEHEESEVDLYKVEVESDSPLIDVSLKDSGFADKYDAMVIAIEREGHFILNPSARITFQPADLVWFVAQKDKAEYLMKLRAADLKSETLTSK